VLRFISAAAVLASATAAFAQSPEPDEVAEGEAAEASTDDEARRIFELGLRAFEDGRFADAARYYTRAWELSQRAVLMYNIGVALERDDRPEDAVRWFERYLATDETVRRAEVEERLQILRARIAEAEAEARARDRARAQPSDATTAAPAIAPDDAGGPGALPWLVAGGGALIAAGGGVALLVAAGAAGTVEDAPQGTPWVDLRDDADQADTLSVVGGVMLGVGGALAVGGLLWALASGGGGAEAPAVAVGPGGVHFRGVL
jgi:tetratricopeptide (TPR) repeat protein